MTATELAALTHEHLIDHVDHALTGSSYLRNPHVPSVRIGAYPKRRRGEAAIGLPRNPAPVPQPVDSAAAVTYADFFQGGDQIAM